MSKNLRTCQQIGTIIPAKIIGSFFVEVSRIGSKRAKGPKRPKGSKRAKGPKRAQRVHHWPGDTPEPFWIFRTILDFPESFLLFQKASCLSRKLPAFPKRTEFHKIAHNRVQGSQKAQRVQRARAPKGPKGAQIRILINFI